MAHPTDIPTVIKIIKNLKNTSTYGFDNIPCKYIKDTTEIIAPHITTIVNRSILDGIVPDIWKTSNVIPLQKKRW